MLKRKLLFGICIAAIIAASGITAFGGQLQWGAGDGRWDDPNNYYDSSTGVQRIPTSSDDVYFWGRTSWTPDALNINVYIGNGVSAVAGQINSLGGANGELTGTLHILYGGSLDTSVGIIMGQLGDSGVIVDGGTFNVNAYGYTYVGHDFNGTFLMRGGQANLYTVYISAASGDGYCLMDNGTMTIRNWIPITSGSQLNIRGGIISCPGDQRSLYSPFIADGRLVAFGGTADVNVAYDSVIGITYITAKPKSTTPYIKTTPQLLTVDEQGATSQNYSIVLNTTPGATVTVTGAPIYDPHRVNLGAGMGQPITKTFTSGNWNTPQTVTVTAIDNAIPQGPKDIMIRHTAVSATAAYNDVMAYADVKVHMLDNDMPTLTVAESGGNTTVSEGGLADSFTVALSQNPEATTSVTVDPNGNGLGNQLRLNGGIPNTLITLTFTTSNWSTPQTVNVATVDDILANGDRTATVKLTATGGIFTGVAGNANVHILDDECGAWGYISMDFNRDCIVNLGDFALFAESWLECTNPKVADCVDLLP